MSRYTYQCVVSATYKVDGTREDLLHNKRLLFSSEFELSEEYALFEEAFSVAATLAYECVPEELVGQYGALSITVDRIELAE